MASPKSNPRAVAQDLIHQVLDLGRPFDEVFEAATRGLEPRDRALARAGVATVLRRKGQIDRLIDDCLARPLPAKVFAVRNALRLGLAELLFLEIPPHAAVSSAVALIPANSKYRGLVNAVLRRLAREGPARLAKQDAERLNTPDWLWRRWRETYGRAGARAIARAHLVAEPPLDLTVPADAGRWAARLDARLVPTGSLRRAVGPVADLPGFRDGGWWVQDAAAALPARLLDPRPGLDVVDLCAAPGGKTAQFAAAGARVTAVDRSAPRLRRVRANLDRLGLRATTVAADARTWRPAAPADAVLLDAPCSATGTIRRHPDVAWLKTAADLDRLAALQADLLAAAVHLVKPGGLLVYCVCSLEPEEGPARIEALLGGGAPVRREPVSETELAGLAGLVTAAGELRTLPSQWPEAGGLDGFYACRLRRL